VFNQEYRTKTENFFYGMITAEIIGYRNIELDILVESLTRRVIEETGKNSEVEERIINEYVRRLVYTKSLQFNWHEDTPEEFLSLEDWWFMVQRGEFSGACYLYYSKHVPNVITNHYLEALTKAHRIWRPPTEKQPGPEPDDPELEVAADANLEDAS
jgi:hypothetical protein